MAAQAAYLMRAFRAANGSFHTWRAGEFDSDMSEATGSQAPPFPVIGYSDFAVIAFLGGPLARSDTEASPVPGLGTVGVPITFALAPAVSLETVPGLDCQDFESVTAWVYITTPGTGTLLTVQGSWAGVAAAILTDHAIQKSDDAIAAGVSPQNDYLGTFVLPPPGGRPLGPFNLPVRGRRLLLGVSADTNDVQGYVLAMRLA